MRILRGAMTLLLVATGFGVVEAIAGPVPTASAAVCAANTKSIGGSFVGEDGRRLSGLVGIALFDGSGARINSAGCPWNPGDDGPDGYTFHVGVNIVNNCCYVLGPTGADPNDTRYANTWRIDGLPANAAAAWIEAYPGSNTNQQVDYTRYGGSMRRTAAVDLNANMLMTLGCSAGGNNGSIKGQARRNGAPIGVTNVVAFSRGAEGTGQILGFIASAQPNAGDGSFTVPQLEPNQSYALSITVNDGSQYWFEHDYGSGVPVNPCATTSRIFDLMPDGRAIGTEVPVGGPGAVDSGGKSYVFFRGDDNSLMYRVDGTTLSLGGQIVGDPDATAVGNGGVDVVARGRDNAVWHRSLQSGTWGPWRSIGGIILHSPSVVSWGGSRTDVIVVGGDNGLWHASSNDGVTFGGWQSLGGYITASPDATSWGTNRIDVAVRGGDGGLWWRSFSGSWSPWIPLGGRMVGGPTIVAPTVNRLDFAVRGGDDGIWLQRFDGAQWVGWQNLGGRTLAEPDAATSNGKVTVFVRGTDNQFWMDSRPTPTSSWSPWSSVP